MIIYDSILNYIVKEKESSINTTARLWWLFDKQTQSPTDRQQKHDTLFNTQTNRAEFTQRIKSMWKSIA